MQSTVALDLMRSYHPAPGKVALIERLKRLAAHGPDEACGSYLDLRPATALSALHAHSTRILAEQFATSDDLLTVPIDSLMPTGWRLAVAAGFGSTRHAGLDLTVPADVSANSLLRLVAARVREVRAQPGLAANRVGAQLMYRLGATRTALELLGQADASADELIVRLATAAGPSTIVGAYAFQYGTSKALEEAALARAEDPALPADEKAKLARFVLVKRAKVRDESSGRLERGYQLGCEVAEALESAAAAASEPMPELVAASAVHRALAYRPFLVGDRATTLAHLRQAQTLLDRCAPRSENETHALWDYQRPLYETVSQTLSMLGSHDDAYQAARSLVTLDPHCARSWFALGRVLIRADEPARAADAFVAATRCESPHRAQACFYAAVCHRAAGGTRSAREWTERSRNLDPSPSALAVLTDALEAD